MTPAKMLTQQLTKVYCYVINNRPFSCHPQMSLISCVLLVKNTNGIGLLGAQYRTWQCFYLGKQCKEHVSMIEIQRYCSDSSIELNLQFSIPKPNR